MSRASTGLYEFGPFRLDVERRLVTRGDQAVPLAPKTFELLLLLVQGPGRAFSKQELMTALWPDTFVEEANLSFQMSVLRKALGETAAQWIETVPKHGYRFTADVRTSRLSNLSGTEGSPEGRQGTLGALVANRRLLLLVGTSVVAVVGVVLYVTVFNRSRTAELRPSSSPARPLTAYQGFELAPSLSPDGSQVTFSWNGPTQDNFDIYVKLVGPGEPVRLTKHPSHDDKPAWSPDGGRIAFLRLTSDTAAELMVMPALGGAEYKIATIHPAYSRDRPFRNLSWTPDGKWLVFGGSLTAGGPRGIWLIGPDSRETRRLTDGPAVSTGDMSPEPSPDGTQIAFIRERSFSRSALFVLPVTSEVAALGTATQLTPETWSMSGLAWTADGRHLVFSSGGHFGISQAMRIPATANRRETFEPDPLPFGEQATAVSISKSGRIVYAAQFRDTALYQIPLSGTSHLPQAVAAFSSTFDEQTPHYSPDGARLAFTSTRSGVQEIWIGDSDGSNLRQITSMGGPLCSNSQWSPDGRAVLFNSPREGSADLYLLRPETGELRRLSNDPSDEIEPRWSRDGRSIYFGSNATGRWQVWRMTAEGGGKTQITQQGGTTASESPDRTFVYYAKDTWSPSSIWRVPVGGGAEERVVDGLSYSNNFVMADRGLYFIAVGDTADRPSIDFFDFATKTRTTIVRLDKAWWYGMALSPDKQSLLFSLIDSTGSNLMVVDGSR